ncbi:hypothetical protein [Streptomyces sp. NPDC059452]|uniref:hypothetical protein n=1 Tax=Streptomyces sp. NPDC059452 TaxID=3346835 RepID=UPI0036CBF36A
MNDGRAVGMIPQLLQKEVREALFSGGITFRLIDVIDGHGLLSPRKKNGLGATENGWPNRAHVRVSHGEPCIQPPPGP